MRRLSARFADLGLDIVDMVRYLKIRENLATGTVTTRVSRINIFSQWLKDEEKPLSQSSTEEFFFYLQNIKNLSNTSLNTYFFALRSLQNYLRFRGEKVNFMDDLTRWNEEDPDIIPLSPSEIKLLKQAHVKTKHKEIGFMLKSVTHCLADTGCRWEDAQNLRCKSVDISGQQLSYVQLKNKLRRNVYIEDPLLSVLKLLIQNKAPEDLVFTNLKGNEIYYSDYHAYLKQLAINARITKRVSPHILRHSYAQSLYDQTGDIYLLQSVLGHKSINSTLRYLRNSNVKIKKAEKMHPHLLSQSDPRDRIKQLTEEIRREMVKYELNDKEIYDYEIHETSEGLDFSIKVKKITGL